MNTRRVSEHMEPPDGRRLLLSIVIAAAAAAVLLVTVVLPAEYGLDPVGTGRLLGLKEMGEIKVQLAAEAEAENAANAGANSMIAQPAELTVENSERLDAIEARLNEIHALLTAGAGDRQAVAVDDNTVAQATVPAATAWRDEISITLTPGQGIEYKLVMTEGAQAEFEWTANGGALNFDTHGDGSGSKISYDKGRGVAGDNGLLVAAFDGNHGWFFRNRMDTDVQLTLKTRGEYRELKRTG